LVAIALYIPFVVFARVQVLPNTSLVNFGALIPTMAALILIYRENKISGVKELLKRSFDFQRIKSKIWYLPIFLLYPCIVAVQYGIAIMFGLQVPSPHFSFWIPIMFVIVFIAALGEELGWMGYAFEPMQERLGTLKASVLLGVVWAAIHIPLFSVAGASPYWIMWQCIYIAVTRVLFVWIYSNTGKSLFAVSAIHATFNISWQFFPPSGGLLVPSFYDPRNLALTVIILTVIVVFFWGPGTLTQYRFAHRTADTKSVQRIDGRRASADASRAAGRLLGPRHGLPITIKEQFLLDGTASTLGLQWRKNLRADRTGPLVTALRGAGAIILGKTNVSQSLSYIESDNPLYGVTRNPWDSTRTPGGSSGGEAAIIAVGGSALGLGSDLGGSVRIPANFCGLAALKPTNGRLTMMDVPADTSLPPGAIYQPGPIARNVADLHLAMSVLVPASVGAYDSSPEAPPYLAELPSVRGLRA